MDYRKNILLIEFDRMLSESITLILERVGFSVIHVFKIEESYPTIVENSIDLIILDIRFNNCEELFFCKNITEIFKIPVVVLSTYTDISDKVLYIDMGVSDYILKPFKRSRLIESIVEI